MNEYKKSDQLTKELKLDQLKFCKDYIKIIELLYELNPLPPDAELYIENINFSELDENNIIKFKSIYDRLPKTGQKIYDLYIKYFNKIQSMKELRILWEIFGFIEISKKEIIKDHFEKFWRFYESEKENNSFNFYQMLCFLKKNILDNGIIIVEFFKKINKIDKYEFIFEIYEFIFSKISKNGFYLTNEEQKAILEFLIKFPFDKHNNFSSDENIYQFLCKYFHDKYIEIDDFYKTSDEIIGIFKIFNFLNKKEVFKKEEFYKNSEKNFINFKNSIEKGELNCSKYKILNELTGMYGFKEKIHFFKFNEIQYNNFIKEIQNKYEFIEIQNNKLNDCEKYLTKLGNKTDLKFITKINSRIIDFKQNSFLKFHKSMNDKVFYEALNKIYKRAENYKKMINLNLKIVSIYIKDLDNWIEGEEKKMQYLENKINKLKKFFSEEAFNAISKDEFKEFILNFINKDELKKEINNLKIYFEINKDTIIIEKYIYFEYKKLKIFQTINDYIEVIVQFNLDKTNFFNKLNELKKNINKLNLQKKNDEKILEESHRQIDEFIKNFESIEPDLNLKHDPIDLISFTFNMLNSNSLLKFLFDLTSNDLIDITNSISINLDIYIIINEYQMILPIIDELKKIVRENSGLNYKLNDINFIKYIPNIINENLNGKTLEEFKNILENCVKNKSKLLDLFENKKGFTKNKEDIKEIIKESEFIIYQENRNSLLYSSLDSKYICRCEFKNKSKIIFLKDLILLQQLASLSQIHEKIDENKPLDKFIELMENIKDFISIIEKIAYKGFPEKFNYNIYVKDGFITCKHNNAKLKNGKVLSKQKNYLSKLLENIKKNQEKAYKDTKFLKFFYGKQLTLFDSYLKGKEVTPSLKNEISNLIYYIIGNKFRKEPNNFLYKSKLNLNLDNSQIDEFKIFYKKIPIKRDTNNKKKLKLKLKFNLKENKDEDDDDEDKNNKMRTYETIPFMEEGNEKELEKIMEDMYYNIEEYLQEIMKINNITEEEIFRNSIINNDKYKNKCGFFIKECGNNIYEKILKFYLYLVGNTPPKFSLLLCNEETTLEELISFIYLAVFCPYHSLFIIAKPDKLNIDLLYEMENILEKIYTEKMKIKSYILFLFDVIGKSEIGNELLNICKDADEYFNIANKPNKKFNLKNEFKNIQIISSSKAGFGKTHYIMKECQKNNDIYISFPLGGEVKRQTIMRRLKELNLKRNTNSRYGLHLDFSDTKQLELFEDFIFSFLIQKMYSNNENIFCYEDNVNIYIEIPNGFYNFMDKFKLFSKFKNKNIDKLPNLQLSEKKFNDFEDMNNDTRMKLTSFLEIQKKNEKLNHYYLYQSDFQIVFNYLKNLNEIDKKNLYFYNYNEKNKELKFFYKNYYIDSENIDEKEGIKLLDKYFNLKNKSYHQIIIYIKVLADQLRKFSNNHYLMVENTPKPEIRKYIIGAFMELTNYFTIGAFDKLLNEQNSCINNNSTYFNEKEVVEKAVEKLTEEDSIINFNQLNNKAFIFINNDGQSFSIITCAPKETKLYQYLDILYNSGAKFGKDQGQHLTIPDLISMESNEQFLELIGKIMDNQSNIKTLEKKLGSYVFNADNFFKMIQIILRLRTGIPVLIMGETGCGKTSLINAIAIINNYKMITFNVHAGVNDNEIVQFMKRNNLLENDIGYDEFEDDIDNLIFNNDEDNSSLKSNLLNRDHQNIIIENEMDKKEYDKEELIIVFFDEFNTCNSLGLLTEIMCSKKCQGINVKKNVVFAGACNPYRKIDKKIEEKNRAGNSALIKEDSLNYNNKLVYTVNPLTYTQLYYIFNFGSLNAENERKYITSIVNAEINDYVIDKNKLQGIKELMIESFMKAQTFIKHKNGKESVSMRETRKFMTIYKFLIKDFERKIELTKKYNKNDKDYNGFENNNFKFYIDKEDDELAQKYCIATTIYICFFIRLIDSKDKIEFTKLMNKLFSFEFTLYPKQLQDELINNIKLEGGIAPNESLRLNLFILFIGILTRIAVFLVGPPGCSKTLCFNILKREMKGYNSKSNYWKEYPQLIVTSYQGSLTSTSKGIIDSFKDAEKKLKYFKEKNKNVKSGEKKNFNNGGGVIICVFIDEIGLCEIAPSNPLKALHTYLELDYKNTNLDEKLAFVGISNWKLDAAKMNRGIYLNVINPISDIEQMYNTASCITEIYDISFSLRYKDLLKNLSKVIYDYNLFLKDINADFIHFHGTRDFYSLIKTTAKKIIEKTYDNEIESALFSIESNYNGLLRNGVESVNYIKKKFKEFYPNYQGKNNFGIEECIRNNIIEEEDSRYLLLIMKSNLSQYLILNILKEIKDEDKIVYFLGSLFEDDIYNEAYSAKAINKIQYYLEQDIVLILKNLSTTYSSLYDLFNQRFTIIKNQKYTEISLGEVTNSVLVNNNLKIIVFIREESVKKQDPPFLNRFEKYIISFDNLLDDKTKQIANNILDLKKIFKNPKKKIKFNFENELINFYDEEIKSIISDYKIKKEENTDIDENIIMDKVLENLAKVMPQELIVFLNHYRMKNYKNLVEKINYFYYKTIHSNIKIFIEKSKNLINVIYTFTPSVRLNKFNFSVDNEIVGNINKKNIKIIYINLIKTEHQLEMDISDFYDSDNKLLIINFEESDSQNLEFVLNFFKRFQKDKKIKEQKMVIILIHLSRKNKNFNEDIFVPSLSGIEQTFIDNLYGKDLIISKILNSNIGEIYKNKLLINLNELFENELYNCFKKINYKFDDKSIEENDYIGRVINYITKNGELITKIMNLILNEIKIDNKNEIEERGSKQDMKTWNIYDYIFENNPFQTNDDYISIFINVLEQRFVKFLTKFIINAEKLSIFSSLISGKNLPEKAKEIWENIFEEFDFSNDVSNDLKSNNITILSGFNLPSIESIKYCKKILEKDNIKEYLKNENEIRKCQKPENIVNNNEENLENEDNEENEDITEKMKLVNEFFDKNDNNINDIKYEKAKEEIQKFFIPDDKLVKDIVQQIEKDKFIKILKKKNDVNLLKLFYEDYNSYFVTMITEENKNIYHEILIYLIELRFGKAEKINNTIDKSLIYFAKSIIWSKIYKNEFVFLLKNIDILQTCFPGINIMERIKKKIDTKDVDYIISNHHPRHKQLIDKPFLLILDSLFLNLVDLIKQSKEREVLDKMPNYFEIIQNAEIYNSNLNLKSKDFYRFKTLYSIIKILNDNRAFDTNIINNFINYIESERKMIIQNKNKEISDSISNQIDFLIKTLPESDKKSKTIMKILISKYKEITNLDCREKLCDIILNKKNKNLLKFSNEFFIYILDLFDFTPESLAFDEDTYNPFSKEAKKNKNYSLLNKINENFCEIISENFKYIFKYKILNYYNNKLKKDLNNNKSDPDEKIREEINTYLGEESQTYFKNCHIALLKIYKGHNDNIINGNIQKIFCIVYCNVFLEKFVKYSIEQKTYVSTIKYQIIKFLNEKKDEIRNVFKLFILKELKSKYIKERTKFLNIEEWKKLYNFRDLFPDLKFKKDENEKLNSSLEIQFYCGDNIQDFLKEKEERILIQCNYNNIDYKQFLYNIDLFINDDLSTLKTAEGYNLCMKSDLMKNFKNYVNKSNNSNGTKALINLFFEENIYKNKLLNTVKDTNYFEILLYAYRFSILCSMAKNYSIYNKMINKDSIKKIFNAYIPGADLFCDLWVESYLNMKPLIKQKPEGSTGCGYYICDCGEYYFQVPCGVPTTISECANCSNAIGGLDEKLVKRNGEYKIKRIYQDERNKRLVESRPDLKSRYGNKFYPSMLFKEFEENIISKIFEEYKGIREQSYLFFINETKKIRFLNQMSYRFLNFIIYSNIYFAYKCGFINLNQINEYKLIPIKEKKYETKFGDDNYNEYRRELLYNRKEGLNNKNVDNAIIEVLNKNWLLLDKSLKEVGVDNIKIFINLIYRDLIDIIINSSDMSTKEKRNDFEQQVNYIISEKIKEYKIASKKYSSDIEKIYANNLEKEYLILESNNKIDSIENEFPYYYEFLSIPLVNLQKIKTKLESIENAEKKYTVLYQYLTFDHKNIKYLESFSKINNFVNYTISHYSNLISREDATKLTIGEELKKNNIPRKLFEDFLNGYNKYKLYEIADKYECHNLDEKVKPRELNESDKLCCFLIDNGVQGDGMKLAALYQKYCHIQNSFLNNVISNMDKNNKKLEYIIEEISEEINPQRANQYNIVSFDISKENYSLLEMLLFHSYKDSFDSDYKYDFSKRDRINYNLEEIEEQLEGLLLPGKKRLNNEIEFVTYQFEGFKQNSKLILSFLEKYPQVKLNDQEKQILYKFRSSQYSTDVIIKILFSMQLMINFYTEKEFEKDMKISETFKDFPNYCKIHEETKTLFLNNQFKLRHIISVYEYFELLCFSEFKKNIDPHYKSEQGINKEKIEKIEKYFNDGNAFINKVFLATAIRRFISRYLVGLREDMQTNCTNPLFSYLEIKEDCWDFELTRNKNLFTSSIEEFKKSDISVNEGLKLYELLGGDDVLLGDIVKNHIMEQEEKEKEDINKNSKKKNMTKRKN